MTAREEMLAAIHAALGPNPPVPEVPRAYRQAGSVPAGSAELVQRFCERVADYQASVRRARPGSTERAIEDACADRGTDRIAAAPAAPWAPSGIELIRDGPERPARELDAIGAALTGCALAIAETGTIVLEGGPLSGRRALTLVPDHHICVVRADQVVADVPDAIMALHMAARARRPITFVSGPSATSDIELQRVEGVHGPRLLDVVVAG